jgi:ribosomal protein S27E|tara:strand:- start:711 stop:1418 length:708 start_codon:yes stop_codon:yes gene_type:complete
MEMKIEKGIPLYAAKTRGQSAKSKTDFVQRMKIGDSVVCSGGFSGAETKRVVSAMRRRGFRCACRTEPGTQASIRVWRIDGNPTKRKSSKKVTRYTKAGKRGKIIECPECGHQSVVYHFSWLASECLGCKGMIGKTDYLLPQLGERKEAKVRAACASDDRVRQFCAIKLRHLLNKGDKYKAYDVAFDALYKLLNKLGVASDMGKLSEGAIKKLAEGTELDSLLEKSCASTEEGGD